MKIKNIIKYQFRRLFHRKKQRVHIECEGYNTFPYSQKGETLILTLTPVKNNEIPITMSLQRNKLKEIKIILK